MRKLDAGRQGPQKANNAQERPESEELVRRETQGHGLTRIIGGSTAGAEGLGRAAVEALGVHDVA